MRDEHVKDMIDLYALGALEAGEQAEVVRHLDQCPACRADLEHSKHVVSLLAWTPEQRDPPAHVYQQLMRRVAGQSRPPTAQPSWWRQLLAWRPAGGRGLNLAPVALAVVLLLGIWNIGLQRQVSNLTAEREQQLRQNAQLAEQIGNYRDMSALLGAPSTRVHNLQAQAPAYTAANGRLLVNIRDGKATLVLSDLPQLPASQTYQLWLMVNDTPVSAGVFEVDNQGQVIAIFALDRTIEQYNAAAISVEPAGGSPAPTSAPILLSQG